MPDRNEERIMQVFEELNINKGLSLALGFFDGVHLGHQAVIKSAVEFAKKNNTKSAVITFQDHPCCFFYHIKPQYIIKKQTKIKLLENLGIDYLYFLKFDEYLAMMNASQYLHDVIIKNFAPSAISTGFNHMFGAGKSGDVKLLCTMQKEFCYNYFEIQPVLYGSETISSTRIREDLILGNIQFVNAMLGYNYFLEETVVEGEHIGRKLGFKTANLIYPDNLVEVGCGVYKVKIEYNGKTFDGIANYGLRPTISDSLKPILEVHILNFDKEIYGEKIKTTFIKKIREEKKFDSLDELKLQIRKDIETS
jgi:riboflavin kinase / FMN adenylyltransferase